MPSHDKGSVVERVVDWGLLLTVYVHGELMLLCVHLVCKAIAMPDESAPLSVMHHMQNT